MQGLPLVDILTEASDRAELQSTILGGVARILFGEKRVCFWGRGHHVLGDNYEYAYRLRVRTFRRIQATGTHTFDLFMLVNVDTYELHIVSEWKKHPQPLASLKMDDPKSLTRARLRLLIYEAEARARRYHYSDSAVPQPEVPPLGAP